MILQKSGKAFGLSVRPINLILSLTTSTQAVLCILLPSYRGGLRPPYKYIVKYMAVAVAVAVAVSGGGAVAVAGLTKRFFNHIQKDFLINVWGYCREP